MIWLWHLADGVLALGPSATNRYQPDAFGIERRGREERRDAAESIAFNLKTGKDLYSTIVVFESVPFLWRIIYDFALPLKGEEEVLIKITFGLNQME